MSKLYIPFLLLVSTILFLSTATTTAAETNSLIINTTITSDTRPMILIAKFCSTYKGHVDINVSVLSPPQPDPSRFGFFLANNETLVKVQQNPSLCALDSPYVYRFFTFRDLSPPPLTVFNGHYLFFGPNEYNIFFANCANQTSVSMVVQAEVFNLATKKECSDIMERKEQHVKLPPDMESLFTT
ncbi:hypothetical protein TSUD_03110 [Trifolium subterraneum]|uniref:CAND6/7 N-terminal domain-containing protein n=1 Tax=Trifolium subterraneum TaxID=3900 RepID=A0A2Z6M6B3_TRISU|nr:hypothetical protein TSUD_03110 [Trifolium subterraneum]